MVGAAIGDDLIQVAYVAGHLWICSTLITLDLRRLALCGLRTLLAAAGMALALLVAGTSHLSPVQVVVGACAGAVAYASVLLITRELSVPEIRAVSARLWAGTRR